MRPLSPATGTVRIAGVSERAGELSVDCSISPACISGRQPWTIGGYKQASVTFLGDTEAVMSGGWPVLLGGSARPLGCTVTFIDRTHETFLEALMAFHEGTAEHGFLLSDAEPVEAALRHLDPMESPWTVELVVECGYGTAYLNNSIGGGDPTAYAPVVARQLGARAVMAEHMPRYGTGHAATQLWIEGPDGEPPLMYERTLSAHATDGRWAREESGAVQPWERPERYGARLKRES